jgi:hypothetical protein
MKHLGYVLMWATTIPACGMPAGDSHETPPTQATIPSGDVSVSPGAIPANIRADGRSYVIPFTIEARVNLDEIYTLTPGVPSVPEGDEPWTAIVMTDPAGSAPLAKSLAMPAWMWTPGEQPPTAEVFLKVTIPLNTPVAEPFVRLDVTSVHNPPPLAGSPSGGSGAVRFQFNAPAQPAQTIRFQFNGGLASGSAGDWNAVSLPVPTPTEAPIDGIGYLFENLTAAEYEMTLEWQDKTNGNRGWTASLGRAPGFSGWPLTDMTIQMADVTTDRPGDWLQKVAIVGAGDAQPNTLTITVRAVGPTAATDYGIFNQHVTP